jgi:hypothetical protein
VGPFSLIIILGVALLEGLLVYKAIHNTRRGQLLAGLPWTEIGQLQASLVKVQGQALAMGETLRAPLSGRDCVYFHFQVQEKRQRGGVPPHGGGSYWKTVINDARHVPCRLDDGTGSAVLRLKSAELLLSPDASERSGFLQSARPELENMLRQRYGYSSVGLIFNRTLYYSETRIEDGDYLLVLGTARQLPEGGWELTRDAGSLLISDQPLPTLLASYRRAALLWWSLTLLLLVAASVTVIGLWR